jgi:hypothetical protein
MIKKLTLTMDDSLIDEAKTYAKSVNRSLSDLISSYLKTLTKDDDRELMEDEEIKELIGCISNEDIKSSYKNMKGDYLEDKYGDK